MKRLKSAGLLLALAVALVAQPVIAEPKASKDEDVLVGRAILPAETRNEGSSPAPAPFQDQPIGGFSALLEAGPDTYWAMTDNGYGSKANSSDFLLRVYEVRPEFETAKGGSGEVEVLDFIQLRDPDGKVPFEIVDENLTGRRLLTGSDFDIESMRIAKDGTLWFGDEFGPFLLHTDATGKVLEVPIPLPGVKAPEDPTRPEQPVNLSSSSGFEGMAISKNGKYLYPSLERALEDDPEQLRRYIYEFDIKEREYTGETWSYRVDPATGAQQEHVIGDLTQLDRHRLLVIERDFLQGEAAEFSKVFVVDLRREDEGGFLVKREVVDLLDIRDPDRISLPARPGDFGLGDPFEFPYVTTEAVLPLDARRLVVLNDNNFGSRGRNPNLPDYNDFIVVKVDKMKGNIEKGD